MTYEWHYNSRNPRQHWLYMGTSIQGLVYEVQPDAFSVYGESFQRNPFARVFLGVMPTLEEAKDMLVTITASQQL
jgi:hypothetical protein